MWNERLFAQHLFSFRSKKSLLSLRACRLCQHNIWHLSSVMNTRAAQLHSSLDYEIKAFLEFKLSVSTLIWNHHFTDISSTVSLFLCDMKNWFWTFFLYAIFLLVASIQQHTYEFDAIVLKCATMRKTLIALISIRSGVTEKSWT